MNGIKIGLAITGSFCSFAKVVNVLEQIDVECNPILPIFSFAASSISTRFFDSNRFVTLISEMCRNKPILTIAEAEPIGANSMLDILVVAPCTGNTLAKLRAGITDTPVLMSAKAHLRNNRPVLIAISTNDGMSANLKNIGDLMNRKNIYFVPFGQDNCIEKPNSLIADFSLIEYSIVKAIAGSQTQPILRQIV
ncbi:MAG: dipicolinate synthase subunit B [Christensenellaceae bacterium]|jgi:dipicolinate synthase subunit B|nr:dipicolinate synthase subunit B [Christensenellaceae bacterium]